MLHLNGNVLVVCDVETTGLRAGYNEITQVAFLPLGPDLKPKRDIVPFDLLLKIEHEERIDWDALRVTKTDFFKHQQVAMCKYEAADLFEDWVQKLKLPERKRISPLAHNWKFDQSFIVDWLGHASFELFFDGRARDTMEAALYINDVYDNRNEPIPFPKVNLSYIASMLKIPHDRAHNALADCVITAEVYRLLVAGKYLEAVE
jgi:DNA polymerase III epsilon subunit-like protein